jgi:hypothetical protein
MPWEAIIPAVGAIGGALIGKSSSDKAAQAQTDAANQANATQLQMYDQTRADNAPLLASRNSALEQINALLANPSGITSQPGYQFGMDQGTRALNSGAAARGMTYSGAQGKALERYGQDYAGTKLDQSYNRLSNLAGLGQVGANNNMQAGTNYANQYGANTTGAGNAAAGSALYTGSAYQNALNQGLAGWQQYGNKLMQPGVVQGSDPYGYNGTFNNPSAYIGGG